MAHLLLFLGFSLLATTALILTHGFTKKNLNFKTLGGLFLFGVFISLPFVLIEYLGAHLKFYIVILTFIAIELLILYFENKIKYFHDLIHHNVKDLRIISFFLIGLGFTYSEITFTIFHAHGTFAELMHMLPLKTVYSLLMHTVLTSAATLMNFGNLFVETIYESVFKLFSYYLRISVISVSHYVYVISAEYNFLYLMIGSLLLGMIAFFYLKRSLDKKMCKALT